MWQFIASVARNLFLELANKLQHQRNTKESIWTDAHVFRLRHFSVNWQCPRSLLMGELGFSTYLYRKKIGGLLLGLLALDLALEYKFWL